MTVKTTLSFTNRHHDFIKRQVDAGIYASASSAVAAAVEQMMRDEQDREATLSAMAGEIRDRAKTPIEEFVPAEEMFARLRATTGRTAR